MHTRADIWSISRCTSTIQCPVILCVSEKAIANVKTRIIVAAALFFAGIFFSNLPDDIATPIGFALACVGFVMLVVEYAYAWRRTVLAHQRMELTGDAGA